jgi:hypothetical protein
MRNALILNCVSIGLSCLAMLHLPGTHGPLSSAMAQEDIQHRNQQLEDSVDDASDASVKADKLEQLAELELPTDSVRSDESEQPEEIRQLMIQLSDRSYRARQLARWKLEQAPLETMREVPAAIRLLDHNAAAQLVDIVSSTAMHADAEISIQARGLLESLSDEVSAIGHLASNTLAAIADLQESQALRELVYWGAYIGPQNFGVNGRTIGYEATLSLRIDESFRGSDETIQRIRFLKSIETVYLSGPAIDSRYYEALAKLPKLKTIKFKHVQMTADDLRIFSELRSLEHFELNYVPIGDEAIPELLELPLTHSLRLFGTKITASGEQQLHEQLDGLEIYRGNGGFLGVATSVTNTLVTQVTPNSAAHRAGIESGDRLTHVDGVPIKTFDDLRRELGKHTAGEQVTIKLQRGTFVLDVEVTLREDPN